MNPFSRSALFWIILFMLFMTLYTVMKGAQQNAKEVSYSEFISYVERGELESVVIEGSEITGYLRNATFPVHTITPDDKELLPLLRKKSVEIRVKKPSEQPWYLILLMNAFPMLLLIGIWIFFMRQVQIGAGKGMSFGKSSAKLLTENQVKVTFDDVAGIDEARAELQEIIEFLKDPKKFTRLGGRIPKGVLLVGPPGTGKTLLAKAIAGEAGVPFFSISGSDFVEMFVGVGASRVRDLFIQGKKNAPCIIFIDEIDAVGRHRGAGLGGGHDEREQTLNQLLVEMDGFESNEGVILIAATNRPDVLDPALLRPGRFDRRVVVHLPDVKGRKGILEVHTRKTPLADDVDIDVIAKGTPGFSGADLEILVNEAALNAARLGKDAVDKEDFEFAKDKVMMGAERRSMFLSDKEKRTTAYHESGHALVAKLLPNADPVHKLTVVPRGMALGLMQQLPEGDKHTYTKDYWLDQLAVFFGGRVAEELVFNEITTGAASDIEQATKVAHRMVCEWGMSEELGPVAYGKQEGSVFLGRDFTTKSEISEHTQMAIDREVRNILEKQYHVAKKILTENMDLLHKIAEAVLERETLEGYEIDLIMEGKELPPLKKKKRPKDQGAADSKASSDVGDPKEGVPGDSKTEDSGDVESADAKDGKVSVTV
ncbi:MAG: ATP-dependent metallopeptidase FtsH/Yme1/Tma family protein [Candidatus Dadabacteria bacterium]|nr:MAG: ATP-dependent metallopeptidase FtsH/Yme1/Tma family protein [Candidatus Dadabacteria bacterium]